ADSPSPETMPRTH
nr:immunoglobulin heavy chain junction region [Homo sapiens]